MNIYLVIVFSISIIFISTTLGSAFVFFLKKNISDKFSSIILGLASGIMIASGLFGLIIPSIEKSNQLYSAPLIPVLGGFILGCLLILLIDFITKKINKRKDNKNFKFIVSVTFHNIPEGLAVGFACGLALNSNSDALMISALTLAIGIAIQNVPEGLAISLPLFQSNNSKKKAFLLGTLSGIVEPIFALIGLFVSYQINYLLPWLLSFAAGAMIYVTIDELLPSSKKEGYEIFAIWSFIIGFCIMLCLEIIL